MKSNKYSWLPSQLILNILNLYYCSLPTILVIQWACNNKNNSKWCNKINLHHMDRCQWIWTLNKCNNNYQVNRYSTNKFKTSPVQEDLVLVKKRRISSPVCTSAICQRKTSLILISTNSSQVEDTSSRALKWLSTKEQANLLVTDTSNSIPRRKLTELSKQWTTLYLMDKLLESSIQFLSLTTMPRLISLLKI